MMMTIPIDEVEVEVVVVLVVALVVSLFAVFE